MNSSIALRLLWKEYRVQRGLWLSMAIGCFALQAIVTFLIRSDMESFQGIVSIAFMLTFFYAIGSGAMTFAIEREEGTQLRPVMLGCPTGLTLIVKTVFGIVAIALLLAITICSGMLMSLGGLTLPDSFLPPDAPRMIIPLGLLFVVVPYLGGLLWSMFFSLLTRKVVVALGLTVVAMIVSYLFVAVVFATMAGRSAPHNLIHVSKVMVVALPPCLLLLFLLASNYLLTHRWLTRTFFDQSIAKSPSFFRRWRIRRSGLDGGMIVEIGVEDRTAFEVVKPELVNHLPPPRFGLSLLYVNWGPNLWRHLRFLRWKEALETRKLFVGFLLATLVLTFWLVEGNRYGTGWHGPVAFFIHAACVACGAMAFRAEQDDRKVQRLADMGLRPATVWFSKHLVWLVRAVLSVAAIFLCLLFFAVFGVSSGPFRSVEAFTQGVWLNQQLPNSMSDYNSELRLVGRSIILILTMYGVGQACSQLIRSTIVSLFVAFLMALAVFGWAGACWWFDVPFILSVLPLAVGCLLVTWCRTQSWMLEDNRARAWKWPTVSIVAAIAVAYFATGLFRVYQIPWSEPFIVDADSAAGEFNDGLTGEQRAAVLAPVSDEERKTFVLYQRASDLLGNGRLSGLVRDCELGLRSGAKTVKETWPDLSDEDQASVEEGIRLSLEAAELPACADFSPATTNIADIATSHSTDTFYDAAALILFDARRNVESGSLDVALDRCRAAFAVSRHAAGRGADTNWWVSNQLTVRTLRALQKWASASDVDADLVEKAIKIIDDHRKQMISIEVPNYASALMVKNTLDANAFELADLLNDKDRLPVLLATKFPGERTRSHRLLNLQESYDVAAMASYRSQQAAAAAGDGGGMASWYTDRSKLQRTDVELENVAYTSRLTTPLYSVIAGGSARVQFCLRDIRTECEVRVAKIFLRLLRKQQESEGLPATLADFDESVNDPWTDNPFIWRSEGLPGDLKRGSTGVLLVKENTPFLMTFRENQPSIVRRVEQFNLVDEKGSHEVGQMSAAAFFAAQSRDEGIKAMMKPGEGNTRVEFLLEGFEQQSAGGIVIWKLPKLPATADETSEVDKAE